MIPEAFARGTAPALGSCLAVLLALATPTVSQSQVSDDAAAVDAPVGTWNLEMQSLTDRPTRGVRNVIVRVSESADGLGAEVINLRNEFVPVLDFVYDEASRGLSFSYGAYVYDLTLESGDALTGTVESPLGVQEITGERQATGDVRFVGNDEPAFQATRPGVIGHLTEFAPPDDTADPGEWVRSRIEGPDDWALVVRSRIAIGFTNAAEFEETLRANAGREVEMTAVWVGERMEIVRMTPTENQ